MALSVGCGVLTYNHVSTGRQQDFETTWETIQDAGHPAEFLVLTNGSNDGTEDRVRELGGIVDDTRSEIWYGNQRLVDALVHNDMVVLSADDLKYEPGWLARMVAFMEAAPQVALASAYMEPVWEWNTPRNTLDRGGERAVVRDSVCGSSWVFRSDDWKGWMGPFPRIFPGEDLVICRNRVNPTGRVCAALDLVEHIGEERSAWGNQSHTYAVPLDREAWGLAA